MDYQNCSEDIGPFSFARLPLIRKVMTPEANLRLSTPITDVSFSSDLPFKLCHDIDCTCVEYLKVMELV
jgi:hypothetical protein